MLFNSIEYLIFFPLVVLGYFLLPYKYRWMFLLAASYYFYMCWKAEYIVLIVFVTCVTFFLTNALAKQKVEKDRKYVLIAILCINLGILFLFKYFNLFNDSFQVIFNQFNIFYNVPSFKLLLPVGISFYTFQMMSYVIDVYRKERDVEPHFGIFALYVVFFPQLVAGPIERSTRLLPQFLEKHDFNWDQCISGLKQALWGLFKKVVVADRIGMMIDPIFENVPEYRGLIWALVMVLYAYQIYCDFSGYSDMAIGCARVLGFDLMKNFDRPYRAKSIPEFWKRWHISLSTWFRDYVYISLGGNRVGVVRWQFNLLIVFVVSGLWHGANWTFVVWGALHGMYFLVYIWTEKCRKRADVLAGQLNCKKHMRE